MKIKEYQKRKSPTDVFPKELWQPIIMYRKKRINDDVNINTRIKGN